MPSRVNLLPSAWSVSCRPWLSLLCIGALALVLAGCQTDNRDQAQAAAAPGQEQSAEKTAVAHGDSAAADSVATRVEKRGGFLGFFRRGDDEEEEPEETPVPVELAMVDRREMSDYFSSTATIEAEKEATLLAKTRGQVLKILVEEGDYVEAGQLLALLDDAENRARLSHAEVKANNMRRELERAKSMSTKGLLSEREMADTRYQLELSESELGIARIQVNHARVVAPFTGLVTTRHIDLGEHAIESTPLFDLSDVRPLLVRVYMPERQVTKIKLGQLALVEPDAAPGIELRGRVRRIAPKVDSRTGTIKVTIELEDDLNHARPGSFVRVRIRTDRHPDAVAIAKRALVHEAGESFVFRVQADTVERVLIVTGYEDRDYVEVLDGLTPGDRIVRVGQGALKIGSHFVEVGGDPDDIADDIADDEAADEQIDTAMVRD